VVADGHLDLGQTLLIECLVLRNHIVDEEEKRRQRARRLTFAELIS
jgi:hypothetical protein